MILVPVTKKPENFFTQFLNFQYKTNLIKLENQFSFKNIYLNLILKLCETKTRIL